MDLLVCLLVLLCFCLCVLARTHTRVSMQFVRPAGGRGPSLTHSLNTSPSHSPSTKTPRTLLRAPRLRPAETACYGEEQGTPVRFVDAVRAKMSLSSLARVVVEAAAAVGEGRAEVMVEMEAV